MNPLAEWTAQQIVEAFPWDDAPRYLLRDRDGVYGARFQRRVKNMGIERAVIARRSFWHSPYVEGLIGSIRRECLDHVIVLNERHLKRILRGYFRPDGRPIHSRDDGPVVEIPEVGGLHHHYERQAA